ncbi:MAG: hypothetical protein OEY83_06485, partial [Candidatus Bathyarchaeota archaeon]|nr:hypothetical protein [Candidatus Bathyarchaeota archaeon]
YCCMFWPSLSEMAQFLEMVVLLAVSNPGSARRKSIISGRMHACPGETCGGHLLSLAETTEFGKMRQAILPKLFKQKG